MRLACAAVFITTPCMCVQMLACAYRPGVGVGLVPKVRCDFRHNSMVPRTDDYSIGELEARSTAIIDPRISAESRASGGECFAMTGGYGCE